MNNHTEGLLAIHSAVLIFGLTALFSKLIALPAIEITLVRSLVATAVLAVYILVLKQSLKLSQRRDYLIAILLGILLGSHWATYFHAMQVSTIAVGIISLYSYPVITVFLEPFFHGEKPQLRDIISAFFVLFGIYLLVPEFSFDNDIAIGVFWGILSAFLFALRNIIQGRYFSSHSARHALMYQTLVVSIVFLPFAGDAVPDIDADNALLLIVLGIFFTALPHTLLAHGLRYIRAKTISLIACAQVVYGTLFAALLLDEIPEKKTIIGGIIVISAAAYETISSRKHS